MSKRCRVCAEPLTTARAIAAAASGEMPLCAVTYCKRQPPETSDAKLAAIMGLLVKIHDRQGEIKALLEKADYEGR